VSGVLFLALTIIVVLAGFLARRRIRRATDRRSSIVSDELLRSILDEEELQALGEDEPLDEDEIHRAEDEFWAEENWTDPDDWRG
jgi:hypothetical protein